MKLLFDTHAFIWWDSDPERLPPHVLDLCEDFENILLLSVASIWEMQIKSQLGKLDLRSPLRQLISSQQTSNEIEILPVSVEHVFRLEALPPVHRDPFDRLLVSQAMVEEAVILTRDPQIRQYEIRAEWSSSEAGDDQAPTPAA